MNRIEKKKRNLTKDYYQKILDTKDIPPQIEELRKRRDRNTKLGQWLRKNRPDIFEKNYQSWFQKRSKAYGENV